jgi:hypothetical protein
MGQVFESRDLYYCEIAELQQTIIHTDRYVSICSIHRHTCWQHCTVDGWLVTCVCYLFNSQFAASIVGSTEAMAVRSLTREQWEKCNRRVPDWYARLCFVDIDFSHFVTAGPNNCKHQ